MIVLLGIIFLYFLSLRFVPILMVQTKQKLIQDLKNKIVQTTKQMPSESFFSIQNHRVSLNTFELNQWLSQVNHELEKEIHELKSTIPIGSLTGITFLSEKGPTFSTVFKIRDQLLCRYLTETIALGINNTMLKVSLEIEIHGSIILGFHAEEFMMKETIPVILEYIQGEVPPIYPLK